MNAQLLVVVEDDRAIRDVLTELFRSEGYLVEGIGDGPSAVQKIQQIRANRGAIGAITLDLTIPGKDGICILKELRSCPDLNDVPIVIISANTRLLSDDVRPLATAVVRKPFDVTDVLDTVARVFSRYSVPRARATTGLANEMATG